jgi:hypothetical protein
MESLTWDSPFEHSVSKFDRAGAAFNPKLAERPNNGPKTALECIFDDP